MNLTNPFNWWQWTLLAGIPLGILALYFLKLKRRPVEVPSTYLWSRTIEDLHVNSIWQRLRRSLLLLLQLLLVALIALALLEPNSDVRRLAGERVIILIDNSASMSATDIGGKTRLEEAKRRVANLIHDMAHGQSAMIISFSNDAQVVHGFTENKRRLQTALDRIQPTTRQTAPLQALQYAAGIANPSRTSQESDVAKDVGGDIQAAEPRPATLYLFTDGGFQRVRNFSLGYLEPVYVPIVADKPANLGIVAFESEQNPERPEQSQAFAQLLNGGAVDLEADVSLYFNDRLVDSRQVKLPAGERQGVTFALPVEMESGVLRLVADVEDDLPLDNVVFATVNPPRRARVLFVSPGNEAWEEHALRTEVVQRLAELSVARPAFLDSEAYDQEAEAGAYDLIVYDQCAPKSMPEANTLFFGRLPPGDAWSGQPMQHPPVVLDSNQTHPLMHLVDLTGLIVAESLNVLAPSGGQPLIEADQGALFALASRRGYQDAVLGFGFYAYQDGVESELLTNFHVRPGFPVFVMNCVKFLGGSRGALALKSVRPGSLIKLRSSSPTELLEVRPPVGKPLRVGRGGLGDFPFSGTETLGVYQVREVGAGTLSDEPSQRFSVNLFSPRETRIQRAPSVEIEHEEVAGQATAFEPSKREYWRWILMGALAVLMFEWYVYNRRIYI